MKVHKFYTKIVPALGMEFKSGRVQSPHTGSAIKAALVRGGARKSLPLVEPTKDVLFGERDDNVIVFHPLAENMFEKGESPVLRAILSRTSLDLAVRAGTLMVNLLTLMLESTPKLTSGQLRMAGDHMLTKSSRNPVKALRAALQDDPKAIANIKITRKDDEADSGAFVATCNFRILKELETKGTLLGVEIKSKRDLETITGVLRNVYGLTETKDTFISVEKHSLLAPRFIALCHLLDKVNRNLNTSAIRVESRESEHIRSNAWFKMMDDLPDLFRKEAKIRPVGNNHSDNDTDQRLTYVAKKKVTATEQEEINDSVRVDDIEIDVVDESDLQTVQQPVVETAPVIQEPQLAQQPIQNQGNTMEPEFFIDENGMMLPKRANPFAGRIKSIGATQEAAPSVQQQQQPQPATPQPATVRRSPTRPGAQRRAVNPNEIQAADPNGLAVVARKKKITEVQAIDMRGTPIHYADGEAYIIKASSPQINFIWATMPNGTPKFDAEGGPVLLPSTQARGHMAAANYEAGQGMSPREFAIAVSEGRIMPDGSPVNNMVSGHVAQYQPTNAREALMMQRQAARGGQSIAPRQVPQQRVGMYSPQEHQQAQYAATVNNVNYHANQIAQHAQHPAHMRHPGHMQQHATGVAAVSAAANLHNMYMRDTTLDNDGNFRP